MPPVIQAVARLLHVNLHGGGPPCNNCAELAAELVRASAPLRADPTVWLVYADDTTLDVAYLTLELAQQQATCLQASDELAGIKRLGRVHGNPVRSQLPAPPEGVLS